MRLTTLILITAILQVSASTFAQKITLSEKNTPLVNVFEKIRQQTGIGFLVSSSMLKDAKPVTIQVQNEELSTVLKEVFKGQDLNYVLEEKSVVVSKKEPSFLEKILDRFNNIDVSGKILDENGKPLPGASVKVKKTGKGVSTDKDGKFFLRGVEEGAVLVVSFIGYLPKEVKATAILEDVVLERSLAKLDDWVYCGSTTSAAALPRYYSRKYSQTLQRRNANLDPISTH